MAVLSRERVRHRFMAAAAVHGWTRRVEKEEEEEEEEEVGEEVEPRDEEEEEEHAKDHRHMDEEKDEDEDEEKENVRLEDRDSKGTMRKKAEDRTESDVVPIDENDGMDMFFQGDEVVDAHVHTVRPNAAAAVAASPASTEASFVDARAYADEDEEKEKEKEDQRTKAATAVYDSPQIARRRGRARIIASDDEDDDSAERAVPPKETTPVVSTRTARTARRVVLSSEEDDDDEEEEVEQEDEDAPQPRSLSLDGYEYDDFVVPEGSDEEDEEEEEDGDEDDDSFTSARQSPADSSDSEPEPSRPSKGKDVAKGKDAARPSKGKDAPHDHAATARVLRAFKATREADARALYTTFNTTIFGGVLPATMEITWSVHLNTTAGRTHLTEKAASVSGQPRTREARIELSTKVLDRPERLRSTLAHEMCHAAAWLVDGVSRPPHGDAFRRWATKVQRHAKLEVTTCHRYEIAFKYSYVCTNATCGAIYGRHSKSVDLHTSRCGHCHAPLELRGGKGGEGVRKGNAFAAYVAANMARVRAEDPGASHKTVMERVAAQYRLAQAATTAASTSSVQSALAALTVAEAL